MTTVERQDLFNQKACNAIRISDLMAWSNQKNHFVYFGITENTQLLNLSFHQVVEPLNLPREILGKLQRRKTGKGI